MTEWFNQRFISRDEHQQIVDYYRKQVARLYRELRELRAQAQALAVVAHDAPKTDREGRALRPQGRPDNVVRIDFRRPR